MASNLKKRGKLISVIIERKCYLIINGSHQLIKEGRGLRRRRVTRSQNEALSFRRRLQNLLTRIDNHSAKAVTFMNIDEDVDWEPDRYVAGLSALVDMDSQSSQFTDADDDDFPEGPLDDNFDPISDDTPDTANVSPEIPSIHLPSSLAPGEIDRLGIRDLANVEIQLRLGQINDILDALRLVLGEKSLHLSRTVRNNKSQSAKNAAWATVQARDQEARMNQDLYNNARYFDITNLNLTVSV
jgi:hypothetical protein